MKYHHQKGITEKDKKRHPKAWLLFFGLIGLVAYSGFAFATVSLNGWPFESSDATAKLVKTTPPGKLGDRLFIPAINLAVNVKDSLSQSGQPDASTVTLKGQALAFGLTPSRLRAASPFFNLSELRAGDEIFLDNNGTRYAYRVSKQDSPSGHILALQSPDAKVLAEPVGTVAWTHGSARLEAF